MKTYFYKVDDKSARPVKLAAFKRVIRKALDYVAKSASYQVLFLEDQEKEGNGKTPYIVFKFADFGDSTDVGHWDEPEPNNFVVTFNYDCKWATNMFSKWVGKNTDLYTIAVHEIGHVLGLFRKRKDGLEYHSSESYSVMAKGPIFSKFTRNDLDMLNYIIRKNQ